MTDTNRKVAALLRQIADLLDYQGVAFKPIAYRRAAQTLDDLATDVSALNKKQLRDLPGIGEAIAAKIEEFLKTGRISFLENLMADVGGPIADLMRVEDLGPKRVREIQEKLGVRTVDELIKAAEQGKLRSLPRFSEILEKKILANAKQVTSRNRRFPLAEIRDEVEALVAGIRRIKGIAQAEAAGSYRRQKPTIGDLDIVVATDQAVKRTGGQAGPIPAHIARIEEAIQKLPAVARTIAIGPTKMSFDTHSGLRVDVRFVDKAQWGSALLYFTGDKEHNIAMRRIAQTRDWKLNEYGLFKDSKIMASKNEEDIYKALGLEWVPPEKRIGLG